jgi:hypothetical protein
MEYYVGLEVRTQADGDLFGKIAKGSKYVLDHRQHASDRTFAKAG